MIYQFNDIVGVTITLFLFVFILGFFIGGLYKSFEKMGYRGWESVIPFWNFYCLLRVPKWREKNNAIVYTFLYAGVCIFAEQGNIVCIIIAPILYFFTLLDVMDEFETNNEKLWAICLLLLPFIFWPVLGFGEIQKRSHVSLAVDNSDYD